MSAGHEILSPKLSGPVEGPAGVGSDLRAARQRLGWALPDVSAWLRIRLSYLEALEDGRVADLPGRTYAVGFLRTYGSALGLDPEDLSRRFRSEAAIELPPKPLLTFPAPVPERSVPVGAVVLVGLVLAIGSYIGWYRLSGEGKLPAEVVPPVPARLAPLAQQAVPLAPPPKPATPAPVADAAYPTPSVPAAPASMSGTAAASSPTIPPSAAAAMSLPPLPAPPTQAADTAPQPAPTPAAATASVAPAAADGSRITLRASADDWVQVRDKSSGQILFTRTLHAGDTWAVPPKPNLFLTAGNAGATEILVDGTLAPSIGNAGTVRRDVPLDPDLLRDGKATVAVTPVSAHTSGQAPAARPTAQ